MIMNLLRDQTALLHKRVEKSVQLAARLRTREAYNGLLEQSFGFYVPIETLLSQLDWTPTGINFDERRKVPLLYADLIALDHDADAISRLPMFEDAPDLSALSRGLGCLYVLEGSTLGGQFIARMAKTSLGIDAAAGGSFHASYGDRTKLMWKHFGDAANEYCGDDPNKIATALEAAIKTFEAIGTWLSLDESSAEFDTEPNVPVQVA